MNASRCWSSSPRQLNRLTSLCNVVVVRDLFAFRAPRGSMSIRDTSALLKAKYEQYSNDARRPNVRGRRNLIVAHGTADESITQARRAKLDVRMRDRETGRLVRAVMFAEHLRLLSGAIFFDC